MFTSHVFLYVLQSYWYRFVGFFFFNAWLIGWSAKRVCCCGWGKLEKIEVKVSYESVTFGNWGPYNITALKPRIATSIPISGSPHREESHTLSNPVSFWFYSPNQCTSTHNLLTFKSVLTARGSTFQIGVHSQNLKLPFCTCPHWKIQKLPNFLLDLNI